MNKKTKALTTEQYKEIIQAMKEGFSGCRPNERIATILVLEGNLGLRISDILKLRLCDIALVQRLLQHSSAATTQRYIGIEPQRIEQAIENHTNLLSATRITPYSPKSTPWIYTIQLQYTIGLWDSNKRDRLGRSLFHSVFQSAGTFPLQQGVCNSFVTGCATVFYSVHEDLYTALRHLSDRLHHRG